MSVTFVSHVRTGYAAADSGTLGVATDTARLTARLRASVNGTDAAAVDVNVLGPGDVSGIAVDAIIRRDPNCDAEKFETTRFACVEFRRGDLPWMFTPSTGDQRVQPWLTLAVVPEDAVTIDNRPGRLPTVIVDAAELPPIDQAWAWAHVQLPSGVAAPQTAGARSRIVCPRQLRPFTRYLAFVVPTFEVGRRAGVGLDPAATLDPAWSTGGGTVELPAYDLWRFSTGPAGDFESLARNLTPLPNPPTGMGVGTLDVSDPGPPALAAPGRTTDLLGALAAPGAAVANWAPADRNALAAELVPAPAAHVLGPPVYGAIASGVTGVPNSGVRRWVGQLNLHPARRAAAGLGATIVRRRQHDFVQEAWEQAGAVEEANRRLSRARLGRRVTTVISRRHVMPRDQVDLLQLIGPLLPRLVDVGQARTLSAAISRSRLPAAALAPSFRRMLRPTGPLARRGVTDAVRRQIVGELGAGTIVPDRTDIGRPGGLVTIGGLLDLAGAAREAVRTSTPTVVRSRSTPTSTAESGARVRMRTTAAGTHRLAITDTAGVVGGTLSIDLGTDIRLAPRSRLGRLDLEHVTDTQLANYSGKVTIDARAGSEDVTASVRSEVGLLIGTAPQVAAAPPPDLAAIRARVEVALRPRATLLAAVLAEVQRPATTGDELEPVLVAPTIDEPMWDDLVEIASDLFLPGAATLPDEHATIIETNPSFVAGLMAGANEEMMRELRWRGYPTDGRGTVFRRFWDRRAPDGTAADDLLQPVDAWRDDLGSDLAGATGELVLVIRSDLLRRYPSTVVFAVPAIAGAPRRPDWTQAHPPSFHGTLPRGAAYYGFPVTIAEAVGEEHNPAKPGWFIVFNQPPTDLGFGLDQPQPEAAGQPPVWLDPTTFGADAAQVATATAQLPIRLAIHASDLVAAR